LAYENNRGVFSEKRSGFEGKKVTVKEAEDKRGTTLHERFAYVLCILKGEVNSPFLRHRNEGSNNDGP